MPKQPNAAMPKFIYALALRHSSSRRAALPATECSDGFQPSARARVLRRTCKELGSPRFEAAEALEKAALAELHARKPDRVLATNVEFWSAVTLDHAQVPPELFTPLFTCARVAGWSAHILEQKREGRLIRPTAKYVGPGPRPVSAVPRTADELAQS